MTNTYVVVVNDSPKLASSVPAANALVSADERGQLINWLPKPSIIYFGGTTTTTSTSDVLTLGMSVTPSAGTYDITYQGSAGGSNSGNTVSISIYVGGKQISISKRTVQIGSTNIRCPFSISCRVTVDGSMTIEGRWSISANTATMLDRTLTYIKV